MILLLGSKLKLSDFGNTMSEFETLMVAMLISLMVKVDGIEDVVFT